jgi:hypothetical protein
MNCRKSRFAALCQIIPSGRMRLDLAVYCRVNVSVSVVCVGARWITSITSVRPSPDGFMRRFTTPWSLTLHDSPAVLQEISDKVVLPLVLVTVAEIFTDSGCWSIASVSDSILDRR